MPDRKSYVGGSLAAGNLRERARRHASETVAAVQAGFYIAPSGSRVNIGRSVRWATSHTAFYGPDRSYAIPPTRQQQPTYATVAVTSETTVQAVTRLALSGTADLAALNFASARNPGGGFLNGALAQEESLCRASSLHSALQSGQAARMYRANRWCGSLLYTDAAVFSPNVPVFRDDLGSWLEKPLRVSFVTVPAPNVGAHAGAGLDPSAAQTLRRRARVVLGVAAENGRRSLVLGAWGCGVFGNSPEVVASAFRQLLRPPDGEFAAAFDTVVFAVPDARIKEIFSSTLL